METFFQMINNHSVLYDNLFNDFLLNGVLGRSILVH